MVRVGAWCIHLQNLWPMYYNEEERDMLMARLLLRILIIGALLVAGTIFLLCWCL